MGTPTDNQILEQQVRSGLQAGDPAVLELIWTHYSGLLFSILLGILFSRQDAEDVLQEVFLRVSQKKSMVASARNLKGYLIRMARNAAIDQINHLQRVQKRNRTLQEDWLIPVTDEPPDPEKRIHLTRCLQQIPEKQRTIILLKVYQEMTFQEIANHLGLSVNTTSSRYRYGLHKLRKILQKEPP